jgi:hypothetical protein
MLKDAGVVPPVGVTESHPPALLAAAVKPMLAPPASTDTVREGGGAAPLCAANDSCVGIKVSIAGLTVRETAT